MTPTDANKGRLVADIIVSNQPDPTPPVVEEFFHYANIPTLINLEITVDIVDQAVNKIHGSEE